MRRAFFFIGAVCLATSSFASIPRASMLDAPSTLRASLPETRIRVSDVVLPFGRPVPTPLNRALHQAYAAASTTNASGLRRFLSVDPNVDIKAAMTSPQRWNRYAYVSNNPINKIDPNGRDELSFMDQLQREQLAVTNGSITPSQFTDAQIGRALAAAAGLAEIGGEAGISALAVRFPLTFMRLLGVGVTATSGVAANSVSLDTNAVVAAVENPGGSAAAVTEAIGGRTPAISATVVGEFLTKGSFSGLANYIKSTGGVITEDAAAELVSQLEARGLKPNDAKAVAGAIESGTKFLTRDKDILKRVPDIAERF